MNIKCLEKKKTYNETYTRYSHKSLAYNFLKDLSLLPSYTRGNEAFFR